MAYKDLRDFVSALEAAGELKRIPVEVDPVLEIAAITDRVSKQFGPALLFERPKGSDVPVLINAFGSEKRMAMALESESVDAIAERVAGLLEQKPPEGLLEKMRMLPKLADLASIFPKTTKTGACKEVIERERPSLAKLPIL